MLLFKGNVVALNYTYCILRQPRRMVCILFRNIEMSSLRLCIVLKVRLPNTPYCRPLLTLPYKYVHVQKKHTSVSGFSGRTCSRCAQFDQRKAKHIAGCLHLHNSLQCSHRHLRIPLGAKRARGGRTSLNRAPPPLNTEVFRCTHYLLPSISVC